MFPQFRSKTPVSWRLWFEGPGRRPGASAGTKNIQFPKNLDWPGFTPHFRDWGGELAFPLPHNTSTPRSWLQDEEEVSFPDLCDQACLIFANLVQSEICHFGKRIFCVKPKKSNPIKGIVIKGCNYAFLCGEGQIWICYRASRCWCLVCGSKLVEVN